MYRLIGILLLTIAGSILLRPAQSRGGLEHRWDGSGFGSLQRLGRRGQVVYKGYEGYRGIVGWFWFLCLEAILVGLGIHLTLANAW